MGYLVRSHRDPLGYLIRSGVISHLIASNARDWASSSAPISRSSRDVDLGKSENFSQRSTIAKKRRSGKDNQDYSLHKSSAPELSSRKWRGNVEIGKWKPRNPLFENEPNRGRDLTIGIGLLC